jgi:hypothetical protein
MSARPTSTKAATRAAMTREYLHTLYQFTERWVVDDSSFRTALGVSATPLDEALDATLAWNRTTAPPTATRQETTS